MIEIFPKASQASGSFNGGQIVENKPIGFPQDGGTLKPYSSLFYWANARSGTESTLPLHPHRGFEIMSFILEGKIKHYDTEERVWKTLQAGDAQVINAGSGLEHSEHMHQGAQMFQIWLDPDIEKALKTQPAYRDFSSDKFPKIESEEGLYTWYVGEGSPFELATPGVSIFMVEASGKPLLWHPAANEIYSMYVIEGGGSMEGKIINQDDFIRISGEKFALQPDRGSRIFVIISPVKTGYPSYQEFMQNQFRKR